MAAMSVLRCLHPPAGAVAVTAVLGGPAIHQLGFAFATQLVPVNAALLVLAAIGLNNLSGRRYPHAAAKPAHATADAPPTERLVTRDDLQAALGAHGELLDVDVADLELIFSRAQLHAGERRWGEVRCRDVMSRDLVTVGPATSLRDAWSLLMLHRIKALPVVDRADKLVGIVSLHDFFVAAADGPPRASEAPRVEEIMTQEVRVARAQQPLADLVEAFSNGGLHHLPVLDANDRLVGMITQSDMVAALFLVQPGMAHAMQVAPARRRPALSQPA
jgi:CBS domain-containing membrane protein